MSRIYCNIESCEHNCKDEKLEQCCLKSEIHLLGCTPDADNVVACCEFTDKDPAECERNLK